MFNFNRARTRWYHQVGKGFAFTGLGVLGFVGLTSFLDKNTATLEETGEIPLRLLENTNHLTEMTQSDSESLDTLQSRNEVSSQLIQKTLTDSVSKTFLSIKQPKEEDLDIDYLTKPVQKSENSYPEKILTASHKCTEDKEFQVNTYSSNKQGRPAISNINNGFVVAWENYHIDCETNDYIGDSIYSQRYDNLGTPLGDEFQVVMGGDTLNPAISAIDNGFVVVWHAGKKIYGKRYDNSANPLGDEFQVNTNATSIYAPDISAIDNGFVVVWYGVGESDSYGIYGRRYDNSANPLGDEFQVNTYTMNTQSYPAISAINDGFVVVWISNEQDGSSSGIYGQRYDNSANPLGGEFQVNTYTVNSQSLPDISAIDNGFVVVWNGAGENDNYGIYGQRYNNSGNPLDNEFQVNTHTIGYQSLPAISAIDDGFVVVWYSEIEDDSSGIYGQRYDNSGNPLSNEFQINSYTMVSGSSPAVSAINNGFVSVWVSANIYGRRFICNYTPVVDYPISNQEATNGVFFDFTFANNTFRDPDADAITYYARLENDDPLPDWLDFYANNRTFQGWPPVTHELVSIKVLAKDTHNSTGTDVFDISLNNVAYPVLDKPIPNQKAYLNEAFELVLPEDTFTDADGDKITYEAKLSHGEDLPEWLKFDKEPRTFSGIPAENDLTDLEIEVTGSDGLHGSASDTFELSVNRFTPGETAGIVLGAIAGAILCGALTFFSMRQRKKNQERKRQEKIEQEIEKRSSVESEESDQLSISLDALS